MKIAARALVELTDDLLVTDQELPAWLSAAWQDALGGLVPGAGPDDPDAGEPGEPVLDPGGS